jgi:transposase
MTGSTVKELTEWVQAVTHGLVTLQPVHAETPAGENRLLAEGYAFERVVQAEVAGEEIVWTERVLVVRSETYRQAQRQGLESRLQRATTELLALTPPPGRGKRQFRDEVALIQAADAILARHAVEGLLGYTFERQETCHPQYVGRGRGSPHRAQVERVTVRYQITAVNRQADAVAALQQTLGWRVYVTDAPPERLTLAQAVLTYRDEWVIERGFHRLKGVPLSLDPLFVKRDDQVTGLTNLLSIAVRLLTLIEFVVRRNLQRNQEKLTGVLPQNPKRGIDNPTTERLLKTFDNITLTIVHLPNQVIRHVTPLTTLQSRILDLLGLSPTIYTRLADN